MVDLESWIAARLLTGTLHGAFVVAVVWLACQRFPAIPAALQAVLWWLASLKLLLVFLPLPAVALPLLPAPDVPFAPGPIFDVPRLPVHETPLWLSVLATGWAAGLLVQAARLGLACHRVRGLVGRATPLPADDDGLAAGLARAVGLRRCPEVRLSAEITGPLVSGIVRPVVLLPETLPRADWSLAICHELVHVRRHDLALGWVPALAERLFFFHPFARLAAREYVTAREAACDAGVLRVLGVSAGDYGRLLVSLGVAHAGPLPAAGGAPTSMASLRRRLNMLQHLTPQGRSRHLSWLLAAALALTLVPFELSARQAPAPAPAALPAPPAIARVVDRLAELTPAPAPAQLPAPAPRPVARAASPQAVAPVAPAAQAAFQNALNKLEDRQWIEETAAAEYRKLVESFKLIAEQNGRLARTQEDELARRKILESTESLFRAQRDQLGDQIEQLRRQQQELTQQLLVLTEQQKQLSEQQRKLNESSIQLFRETERLGNAVSPRK